MRLIPTIIWRGQILDRTGSDRTGPDRITDRITDRIMDQIMDQIMSLKLEILRDRPKLSLRDIMERRPH